MLILATFEFVQWQYILIFIINILFIKKRKFTCIKPIINRILQKDWKFYKVVAVKYWFMPDLINIINL